LEFAIVGTLKGARTGGGQAHIIELVNCRITRASPTVTIPVGSIFPSVDNFMTILQQSAEPMGQERGQPVYRFHDKYELPIVLGKPTKTVLSYRDRKGTHELLQYQCSDGVVVFSTTYDLAGAWIKDIHVNRTR